MGARCRGFPNAHCVSDYCEGCNARWFDRNAEEVQCGGMELGHNTPVCIDMYITVPLHVHEHVLCILCMCTHACTLYIVDTCCFSF